MDLKTKLSEAFEKYEYFKSLEVHGSAFAIIGEFQNIIDNYYLENRDKFHWMGFIKSELEAFSDLAPVYDYLKERLSLINRVSSVGTVFTEEEIVLLLTASIEAEMICTLLVKNGQDRIDLQPVNKCIEEISDLNKKAFQNSINMIRKNAILPVVSHWITDYKN